MKLSIITVCLNSHQTIADTINSVNSQTFNNIEHIFVDGGSQDETIELIKKNPNKNKKIFIKKNYGIYKSMNYGIKKASGDLIQILNSDDVFQSNDIVEKVIKNIKKNPQYDLYLGNVVFFKGNNFNNSKRHFTAKSSQIKNMINGQMPPHPACFVRKEIYRECIMYNEKYKIAADFEFFNEIFNFKKKKFKILNQNVVRMRLGGISTRGLKSYLNISKEIIKSSILKKTNVVTVIPEIIDPIFFYLKFDVTINYDPVTNLTDETTLKTNINTSVQGYLQTSLEKFDQKFRYSQLTQSIDNTNNAIRNNRTTVKYEQRVTPATLNTPTTYTLLFNNELEKSSVMSTAFTGTDGFTYQLIDNSLGYIKSARTTDGVVDSPQVYLIQPDGSTNQGTIDYTTGKVILNNFRPVTISGGTDYIQLTVTPLVNNSDVTPVREQILTYDVSDTKAIVINMVAETII